MKLLTSLFSALFFGNLVCLPISAQITPDGTTSTTVTPTTTGIEINNGDVAGSNLFHSFGEFSVPPGSEAFFNNADSISNIFSRVTGGDISAIDGILRANGTANLFLINPAGIVFGEGASLQLGGSFYGSTADSIVFSDGEFSATDLDNPPLITINAPIGLGFRDNPAPIVNSSIADDVGLEINPGATISFIGGNIGIFGNGGTNNITAPGGKVWLGGLVEAGTVNLDGDLNPTIADGVTRADIFLSNGGRIDVAGDGGTVTFVANNITLNEASLLFGGIAADTGTLDAQAGNINLDAKGAVELIGESKIRNRVEEGATGSGGNINVAAQSLNLIDGSNFSTSLFGTGKRGNINIDVVDEVTLSGGSRFFSTVGVNGTSDLETRSSVNITAGSFTIADGESFISTSTFGQGDAGNVVLDIDGEFQITGGTIFSNVEAGAVGEGGTVTIEASSLSLLQGGQVQTLVRGEDGELPGGQGNAGNVSVDVEGEVFISGTDENRSAIFSSVGSGATGNAGNIAITANSLSLEDGGLLQSSTFGQGSSGNITIDVNEALTLSNNGDILNTVGFDGVAEEGVRGNIKIAAGSLSILDGESFISTSTFGQGDAGNINLEISNLIKLVDGEISSEVESEAVGNAGNIEITTNSLVLEESANIDNSTSGTGNAGDITLNITEDIVFRDSSNIFALVREDGNGNGSNVNITATNFSLINGSQVSAGVFGKGNAGEIIIEASGDILLEGIDAQGLPSGVFNTLFGEEGSAGNIQIKAQNLTLRDGGVISSTSSGQGNAGTISIETRDELTIEGFTKFDEETTRFSSIKTTLGSTGEGKAGDINITANSLSLKDSGFLSSSTFGKGNSGNINIDIAEAVTLSKDGDIFNEVEDGAVTEEGSRGNVSITAGSLNILDVDSSISTSTSGTGDAGNINLDIEQDVIIIGGEIASEVESEAFGNAGNITIDAWKFSLLNGADIDSSTAGQGNSGFITITADGAVTLDGDNTAIFNNVERGGEGNSLGINITSESLSITDGAQVQALVRGTTEDNPNFGVGNAGDITIDVEQDVEISGIGNINSLPSKISSDLGEETQGNAGNITIDSETFSLLNGAEIDSSTSGKGNSGLITITVDDAVTLDGDNTTIFNNVERGGEGSSLGINITSESLSITDGAQIQALVRGITEENSNFGVGNAGDITIDVEQDVEISGIGNINNLPSEIASDLGEGTQGSAGNITVTAENITLLDGGIIVSSSFGQGNGGTVNLEATGNITVKGSTFVSEETTRFSSIGTILGSNGIGNAGTIEITANSLSLKDGGFLQSDTFGKGNSGNINIDVTEAVTLSNDGDIFNDVGENAVTEEGSRGNIEIAADSLILTDEDSDISTSTFGKGNAGNVILNIQGDTKITGGDILSTVEANAVGDAGSIEMNTGNLSLTNGAAINTSTLGDGNAGSININANDSILIDGTTPDGEFSSGIASNVEDTGSGDGGTITINTDNLSLSNQGLILVESSGEGDSGVINITANSLNLNQGEIRSDNEPSEATPEGLQGGNINLSIADNITLRNNSLISAEAGENANGGDIDIDTQFILAYPSNGYGNDIIANAEEGRGGNIRIKAEAILGIEESKAFPNNGTNNLDASSQDGVDGQVSIDTPDTNPIRETTEVSDRIVTQEIVSATDACAAKDIDGTSNLVVEGKGGSPSEPTEPLNDFPIITEEDLTTTANPVGTSLPDENANNFDPSNIPSHIKPVLTDNGEPLYAARGVITKPDGGIILTAYPTPGTPGYREYQQQIGCDVN